MATFYIQLPEHLLNFLLNAYILPWLVKVFQENAFVSQNIESSHLYSSLHSKIIPGSYHHPKAQGNTFRELKKGGKINLRGYWSQVLLYLIIIGPFTFLISVLLHHNLDSSMLKCTGSSN